MDLNGLGGGLMLAVAAVLWMVYLIPNWLKRREYLATERNAVRLQQTIRVLSETSEAPVMPHRAALPAAPAATRAAPSRTAPNPVSPVVAGSRAAQRVRRTRTVTALILIAAVIAGVVQTVLLVTTGVTPAGLFVAGVSAIVTVGSFALLGRLAHAARARRMPQTARPAAARRVPIMDSVEPEAPAERERTWMPVPVPKPTYLSRPAVAPSTMEDPRIAAAAEAERRQRPAEREVAPIERPAAREGFAAMGIVDAPAAAAPLSDLDAVLARRRAAG